MTEPEYNARMLKAIDDWTTAYPEAAQVMRVLVRRKYGKLQEPPAGSLRALVLRHHFEEAVREFKHWPTFRVWATEKRLASFNARKASQ